MMNLNDFANYIAHEVKGYLPPDYQEAKVEINNIVKNNDISLCGISIRRDEEQVVPLIYVDDLYDRYVMGEDPSILVEEVASMRLEYDASNTMINKPGLIVNDMLDNYEIAKENLLISICNTERNQIQLLGKVRREIGEFSETYRLCMNIRDAKDYMASVGISYDMLDRWGVSPEQLHEDAIIAENKREPLLATLHDILRKSFVGTEPVNILTEISPESMYDPDLVDDLYILSTADTIVGAHMMLRDDILSKAGDFFENDFYVLPSSVHEVLLAPVSMGIDVQELNVMVRSINGNPEVMKSIDILSDNVYSYNRDKHVLINTKTGDNIDLRKDGKFVQNDPYIISENKSQSKPKKKHSR